MRARRALLYMPGDEIKKIRKATTLSVDCICMDLEDGVAQNRKDFARTTIKEALQNLDFGKSEVLVRINRVGSGLEEADLQTILTEKIDGIVIPKVETGEQIQWVSEKITAAEISNGWFVGGIGLIAIVETARGIISLPQIAGADKRLQALIFGAEDLAADIGATRSDEGQEILYARSAVILHAAAYNLQALDIVNINFDDLDSLRKEAEEGSKMGFVGKQIIHPKQVDPVQEAFTPTDTRIAQACELLETYRAYQDEGVGAYAVSGKMIDAPLIKMAQGTLLRAYAAGKIEADTIQKLLPKEQLNFFDDP